MKTLKVDEAKCIGCGACVAIDEEDFEFNDEGLSKAKNTEVSEDNEKAVEAMESCPAGAITLE